MGSITRTLANNITTGGVILPSGINNTSISNVTSLPAGVGGKVLQVVQDFDKTDITVSSGTSATVLSVTITPSSTSSKILLRFNGNASNSAGGSGGFFRLKRGSTEIAPARTDAGYISGQFFHLNQDNNLGETVCLEYLDSPSTTSATTYNLEASPQTGGTLYLNKLGSTTSAQAYSWVSSSTLTAFEIGT